MIALHDEILSTIEQRGLADGVPIEQLDAHVADVLGVPPDHYAAWRLVGGAITSYASVHIADADGAPTASPQVATVAGQLSRLWEQLGRVHQATVTGAPGERVVRDLIGELFILTDWLLATSESGDRATQDIALHDLASEGVGHG